MRATWQRMREAVMPAARGPRARGLPLALAVSVAVCWLLLLVMAVLAAEYGYWRPDTWQYLDTPRNEFEYNYRWLVPIFYYGLKWMPSYAAWLLAGLLYGYFGYGWARRHMRGAPWDSRLLALLAVGLILINPGLQDQLTWPSHTLAAISILAVMTALADRVPKVPLVLAGTLVLFGVHQSFAFLTLLFLVPGYAEQSTLSPRESLWRVIEVLCWWGCAFLLAWAVTQVILYLYFGHIPEIYDWRQPRPAHSLAELWVNLLRNAAVMVLRLRQFYTGWAAIAGGALVAAALVAGVWRKTEGTACHAHLMLYGLCLYAAPYVVTAPVGTAVPFRLTLIFGPAAVLLMFSAMACVRRPVMVLLVVLASSAYPAVLTLGNMHWFGGFTAEITRSVMEIREREPRVTRGVLVDVKAFQLPDPGPEQDRDFRWGVPQVFDPIHSPYAFTSAFYASGFSKVSLCDGNQNQDAPCDRLVPAPAYTRCSTLLSQICSGGYSADGFWRVRL